MRLARSNEASDAAGLEPAALQTTEDLTNLVDWTLSTALENVDEPVSVKSNDGSTIT